MKKLSKVLVLVLSAIMVLAMSASVFAAGGTPSITINPNNDPDTTQSVAIDYTYYKILSADIDADSVVDPESGATTTEGQAAYYVENQAQATALEGTGLFTVTKVDGENKWYVELKTGKTAEDIVAAFDDETFLANFTKQTYTKAAGTASAVLPNVTAGYYFIKSSLGTKAAVQTLSPVTINEKNSYPGLTKDYNSSTDALAGIGDEISYKIEVTIPESVAEKPIKITDTITNGLTMNTAVTVAGAVADPAYTSDTWVKDTEASSDGKTVYTIEIPAATVLANKGKTLTFTYKATVNEDAVVLQPETNTAHLEYDNFSTKDVAVKETKTLAADIQKVDGADKTTVLAGAEFKLYDALTGGNEIPVVLKTAASDENGNVNVYRVAVEGETGVAIVGGTARIEGLNDQDYFLEETKAPTGYNPLETRQKVTASEASSTTAIDLKIENNKGATLPSTGGIGTTIFYVLGSLLVVGCGIVLVSRKRMQNNK